MNVGYTLGTANLGLAYGTVLRRGLPDAAHVEAMLRHCNKSGFTALDTARAYGLSEERIGTHIASGQGFSASQVGTKIAPFPELGSTSPPELGRKLAEQSLGESRTALGVSRLERVLLHRASHFRDAEGAIWKCLLEARAAELIGAIGVSVQSWDEFRDAVLRPDVDVIQLPCNILDWRFDTPELQAIVAARGTPIAIEVRSVHLQGVLPSCNPALFPTLSHPYDAQGIASWLRGAADRYAGGRMDALCQRYMASLAWVSALVMGVDCISQIDRISEIAAEGSFAPEIVAEIRAERPVVPQGLLNPALWR